MIKVIFKNRRSGFYGFTVKGHSGYSEAGTDIICASVSSAAYMTVNTLTEVLNIPVKAEVDDGFMDITLLGDTPAAQDILKGLHLHLMQLCEQYPDFIKISTEV